MPYPTSSLPQSLLTSSSSKKKSEIPANFSKKHQIHGNSSSSSSTSISTSEHSLEHSSEHSADYSTEMTSSSSAEEHSLMYQNQSAIFRRNAYSINLRGVRKGVERGKEGGRERGRDRGRVDGGGESFLMQNEGSRNTDSSTKYRIDMTRNNSMNRGGNETRIAGMRREEEEVESQGEREVEESSVDSSVEMQAYVPPSRKDRYLRTYNSTNTFSPSFSAFSTTQNLTIQDPPHGGKIQNPGSVTGKDYRSTLAFTSPSSSLKSNRKSPETGDVQSVQDVRTEIGTGGRAGSGVGEGSGTGVEKGTDMGRGSGVEKGTVVGAGTGTGRTGGEIRSRGGSWSVGGGGYTSSLQELADLSIR